ncbi:MAG: DUF2194 domain-containing protein [Cetobacterium sp.]|nr:DUF2194 domain-containing protein [Cetobacterium sp.]
MKFRYILTIILIIVSFFQVLRIKNIENLFDLNQKYNFTLDNSISGKLKIENPKRYLILYDQTNEIKNALEKIFDFSRIKYDSFPIWTGETLDFAKYSLIILTSENYKGLLKTNYLGIKMRIKNGGNLFIAQRSYKSPFNNIAGIEKIGDFIDTRSFNFKKDIFPGIKKLKPNNIIFTSSGLDLKLKENIDIIASTDDNIPLMWTINYGKGKVFYNNSTLFQGKSFRGIMKQLISFIEDISFYPILNSKVVHIDDFPSPIPILENEIIRKEYNMNTKEFFNFIWWKDMMEIITKENLKITGFMIVDYNDKTTKNTIVRINKETFNDLSKRGRELKSIGGELGVHGYNHYSLGIKNEIDFKNYGYTSWEDIYSIKAGLRIVLEEIKDLYGENFDIYSYVAPSNLLSKTGKKALVDIFKNLKVLCGVFYGEKKLGVLLQEVGRDPDFPNIYSLPRMSSGFLYTDINMWHIYNSIGAYGYVSHFIHPDDILDKKRAEGKSWEKLKIEFKKIFSTIDSNYSVLKPETQSEMTYDYSIIENLDIDYEIKDNIVYINIKNYKGKFDSHFRIKGKKIKKIIGGTFKLISKTKDNTFYIITAQSAELKIMVKDL